MNRELFIFGIVIALIVFAGYYFMVWKPFKTELDYLRMELKRSFEPERRERYRQKIKRHYFKCIPFLRHYL